MTAEQDERQAEVLRLVVERCATAFGVTVAEVMAPSLSKTDSRRSTYRATRARTAAWYLLARHAGFTQTALGRAFGRDHTTVSKGIDRLAARMRSDEDTRLLVFEAAGMNEHRSVTLICDEARRELATAREVVRRLEALVVRLDRERGRPARQIAPATDVRRIA